MKKRIWFRRDLSLADNPTLTSAGLSFGIYDDDCLLMPESGLKKGGTTYRVFTPFWRQVEKRLVDAGMCGLWETGWMHNRVRMIVVSFINKNLGIPWQAGAPWFDADQAYIRRWLGKSTFCSAMVELKVSRNQALTRYQSVIRPTEA